MSTSPGDPAARVPSPAASGVPPIQVDHLPPPPGRRPNRLPIYVGIGAVVAVLLLLLVAVILPGLGTSGSGGGSGALTYSQALPIANRTVSGYQSQTWSPILADGVDVAVSETLPLNLSALTSLNCTFVSSSGGSGSITVPNYLGNRSGGVAPLWVFFVEDGAKAVAVVTVVNGQGAVAGTLTGRCTTLFDLFSSIPTGVIDSSRAAAAVAADARPFLTAYPNASASFAVIGGLPLGGLGPEWEVDYTTCSLSYSAAGSGYEFNATVNALTGQVLSYRANQTVSCSTSTGSGSTPITTALGVGAVTSSSNATAYLYNVSIASASNGVTWSDLNLTVYDPTSSTYASGWTVYARDLAGVAVATCRPLSTSPYGTWSGAPQARIVAGDVLQVESTVSLSGDELQLNGAGSFSGSILVFL